MKQPMVVHRLHRLLPGRIINRLMCDRNELNDESLENIVENNNDVSRQHSVPPKGFEPSTFGTGNRRSNPLSYGGNPAEFTAT